MGVAWEGFVPSQATTLEPDPALYSFSQLEEAYATSTTQPPTTFDSAGAVASQVRHEDGLRSSL
jgi:hypothetical protein